MKLTFSLLHVPFKVAFKHNSASRSESSTFWVEARDLSIIGSGEGCPRIYVTGETEESCVAFFQKWIFEWEELTTLSQLKDWVARHSEEIDANPSAWCAVEMAILDLWAQRSQVSIAALLGIPSATRSITYSAVLGDSSPEVWKQLCQWHLRNEMFHFKLKVNGDESIDRIRIDYLLEHCPKADVRLDANNLWQDVKSAALFLEKMSDAVWAIEEPLSFPNWKGLNELANRFSGSIILDEHACRMQDLDNVEQPAKMILNLRVSKCGGIIRSAAMAKAALSKGMKVIVGAQVGESSALTRAGLTVVHALDGNVLAIEGGYGLNLLEEDYFRERYQFGQGGKLSFTF